MLMMENENGVAKRRKGAEALNKAIAVKEIAQLVGENIQNFFQTDLGWIRFAGESEPIEKG